MTEIFFCRSFSNTSRAQHHAAGEEKVVQRLLVLRSLSLSFSLSRQFCGGTYYDMVSLSQGHMHIQLHQQRQRLKKHQVAEECLGDVISLAFHACTLLAGTCTPALRESLPKLLCNAFMQKVVSDQAMPIKNPCGSDKHNKPCAKWLGQTMGLYRLCNTHTRGT